MGKQSELIITKGQEFKIVVKDSIKEDDVFIDQYEQAAGMLNTIVAESIAAGERAEKSVKALYSLNEYENNIIAFCGERGEGKSSAMLTFINSLYTNLPKTLQGDDKFYAGYPELRKVHFSAPIIIDPSQFDDVHNILDIILAKIYRNFDKIYEENNRCVDEYDVNRLQNQFQKVYREVSMINNQSKMLDDDFDYEGNIGKLSKLGESTDLKEDLQELIKQYLAFIKKCSDRENEKERLIIAIDDLDLCNSNAYKMAEQIRKYLIIPQIIIIMAVKIEQLELCVEENTIAEFKGVVSTEKRQAEEKQNRIGVEIQGMSERYVAKLIPKARRIYLPKAQSIEDIRVIYKEKDTEEKKGTVIWESETNENLVKAVLDLIRERTGMIFLPEKSGMSYLLPDNLRDMVNWIVFVADMKKVCIPQKEDESKKDLDDAKIQEICLKNIKKFVQYFNGEWITRQMPDSFGRELRLMEKMDNLHMNLNANWFLKKLYMSTDKKENEKNDNDISKKVGAYWKNIQWFIWFKDNIYDMDIERKSYGLKVLYTAKLNQWIREGKSEKATALIGGYIWGSEVEGVLPGVEKNHFSRSRFLMETDSAIRAIESKFDVNNSICLNLDSNRLTVARFSNDKEVRKHQICIMIMLTMFANEATAEKKSSTVEILGNAISVARNSQLSKNVDISVENYIVSLCDLPARVNEMNLEFLGDKEDILEIVNDFEKENKETIDCARIIATNIDCSIELLEYCKQHNDYKDKTESINERTKKVVEKFFENIRTFIKMKTGKRYAKDLFEVIKIGGETISIVELYAEFIAYKIQKEQIDIDVEVKEFKRKLEEIPEEYKENPKVFAQYVTENCRSVERIKEELDLFAKNMQKHKAKNQGKLDKELEGLNIEKICDLYKRVISAYNAGKEQRVSDDIYQGYVNYVAKFRKPFVDKK